MLRDITMILSVLVSVVSLSFGVYKNIEAGNAKSFAYAQAYRIIGMMNTSQANVALNLLSTPPPVIDLSRSSAGVQELQVCTEVKKSSCIELAGTLASQNADCVANKGIGDACSEARKTKAEVSTQRCITCFTK